MIRLLILILFFPTQIFSQNQFYQNLIFEGGGIRGVAYGGAIQMLEQKNMLDSIKRVGGTSSGAIQASLLAVGFSADEIIQLTNETDLKQFNDGKYLFIGGISRLNRVYGWYRGEKFAAWIEVQLEKKTGIKNITLRQLHDLSLKNPKFKDLYLTATDLTLQKAAILSYETFPQMKVKDAVRISMSIPLYYGAIFVDQDGNTYNKPQSNIKTSVMIDGGVIANFPLLIFDDLKYLHPDSSGYFFNTKTLGIKLERQEQIIKDLEGSSGLSPYEINNLTDYINAFYNLTLESLNRNEIEENINRIIFINTSNISPRVRRLNLDEKQLLINNGRIGVENFLIRNGIF